MGDEVQLPDNVNLQTFPKKISPSNASVPHYASRCERERKTTNGRAM